MLLLCCALASGLRAEVPVSVRSVEFREALAPAAEEPHLEIAINLRGERTADERRPDGFHRDVNVRLELAFNVGRGREEQQTFYRAEARLVGLAPGDAKTVFFYLPPEVVRRDRLRRPVAWRVALQVEGRALPQSPGTYSTNLSDPLAARAFVSRLSDEAAANDGILLPIYLTRFYQTVSRRLADSPSYVRPPPKDGAGFTGGP